MEGTAHHKALDQLLLELVRYLRSGLPELLCSVVQDRGIHWLDNLCLVLWRCEVFWECWALCLFSFCWDDLAGQKKVWVVRIFFSRISIALDRLQLVCRHEQLVYMSPNVWTIYLCSSVEDLSQFKQLSMIFCFKVLLFVFYISFTGFVYANIHMPIPRRWMWAAIWFI